MDILMLGWELPPRISGGLGRACDGLLRGIASVGGMNTTFMLPRTSPTAADYPECIKVVRPRRIPLTDTPSPGKLTWHSELLFTNDPLVQHDVSGSNNPSDVRGAIASTYSVGLERLAAAYADDVMNMLPDLANFDIIHAHDWLTFEAGVRLKLITQKKLVVHTHSTEFDRASIGKVNPFIKSIEQRGMDSADQIIAVSDYTKDIIVRLFGQNPNRIKTIYNGAEFSVNGCDRIRDSDADRGEKIVTFLGRVTYQKGPEQFIEAAYQIWLSMPDTKFVMAGDGDLLPLMKSLARSLGMSNVISFPGFLNPKSVRELLSKTAVFIMPSISEPFGLAALEAIEANVPVILSDRCGLTETIKSTIAVDPDDIDSITAACIHLLKNPSAADHLAMVARSEARCHTWERSALQLYEVYGHLLRTESGDVRDVIAT